MVDEATWVFNLDHPDDSGDRVEGIGDQSSRIVTWWSRGGRLMFQLPGKKTVTAMVMVWWVPVI